MTKLPKHRNARPELILGPLPVEGLNLTLGLDLSLGLVVLSPAAQKHAATRHPEDYPRLLPHIATIVSNPLYVGDDFHNDQKIELIGTSVGLEGFGLVAVSIQKNTLGNYHVVSFYPVSRDKINKRREKGFLQIFKTK